MVSSEQLVELIHNPQGFSAEERMKIVNKAIDEQMLRLLEPDVRDAIIAHTCLHVIGVMFSFRKEDQAISSHAKAFTEQTIDAVRFPKVSRDGFSRT